MTLPLPSVQRLRNMTLLRYVFASAVSLALDLGSFMILLTVGAAATPAAAAGYTVGILAHWLISSRKVFADTVAERGRARTWQKAMFVGSALLGLGVTTLVVGAATLAGADARLGKLAAVVASFGVTWMLRSRIIFAAEPSR